MLAVPSADVLSASVRHSHLPAGSSSSCVSDLRHLSLSTTSQQLAAVHSLSQPIFLCLRDQTFLRSSVWSHFCQGHGFSLLYNSLYDLARHIFSGGCFSSANHLCSNAVCNFGGVDELRDHLRRSLASLVIPEEISTKSLVFFMESCYISIPSSAREHRATLLRLLSNCAVNDLSALSHGNVRDSLSDIVDATQERLQQLLAFHSVSFHSDASFEDLHVALVAHIVLGGCLHSSGDICRAYRNEHSLTFKHIEFSVYVLRQVFGQLDYRLSCLVLSILQIRVVLPAQLSKLRTILNDYILQLIRAGRSARMRMSATASIDDLNAERARNWPQKASDELKLQTIREFRHATGPETCSSFICCCCGRRVRFEKPVDVAEGELSLDVLKRSGYAGCPPSVARNEFNFSQDLVLEYQGVFMRDRSIVLRFCQSCYGSLCRDKLPRLALANHLYVGEVPLELKELTIVEEALLALCRAKVTIITLNGAASNTSSPLAEASTNHSHAQKGFKGHAVAYMTNPHKLTRVLPRTVEEIVRYICVIFIGSHPPTKEWMRKYARPLVVRRRHIHVAAHFLAARNPLFRGILVNQAIIDGLPEHDVVDVEVTHVQSSDGIEQVVSDYSKPEGVDYVPPSLNTSATSEPVFDTAVVLDIDAHTPSKQLNAACFKHFNRNRGSAYLVPHDREIMNEFNEPNLLPMLYPTLYPYGVGGFEDPNRRTPLSFQTHAKYLLQLADRRFQEHVSWKFVVFNIIQRRTILLHTFLRVKTTSFRSVVSSFSSLDPNCIQVICDRILSGKDPKPTNYAEREVVKLMNSVKLVTRHVPGSAASRFAYRNEIRALEMEKGPPTFFITINPADIYNPLVKFLTDEDFDMEHISSDNFPDFWEQTGIIARNGSVGSEFFHIYFNAFFRTILRYSRTEKSESVLGWVDAFYFCSEAQGRGSLHGHGLVWSLNALHYKALCETMLKDPSFSSRFFDVMNDTIVNSVPVDPVLDATTGASASVHPCSTRGVELNTVNDLNSPERLADLANLVERCQRHQHTATCYKYWKGPPHPKECRFDLAEENTIPENAIDTDTGEIVLRISDGLINNYNATIIEAVRCNMDLKFVTSGKAAKAVTRYITDYVAKTQLKSHISFAALQASLEHVEEHNPDLTDAHLYAKKVLQRCAFTMTSLQELSAQQVMQYLLGYGDHYTSHEFRPLYWSAAERFIDAYMPSPECYYSASTPSYQTAGPARPSSEHGHPDRVLNENESTVRDNENDDDDEVTRTSEVDGTIGATASQLHDYLHRPFVMDSLCLWEFVRCITKLSSRRTVDALLPSLHDGSVSFSEVLANTSQTRPTFSLPSSHLEHAKRCMSIVHPDRRPVVVFTGPSFPHRAIEQEYPRYCRTALICFKPFRHHNDLRLMNQTWQDAYDQTYPQFSPAHKAILDNIQFQHECKDSRDDHIRSRNHHKRNRLVRNMDVDTTITSLEDDAETVDEDEIMASLFEHLQSVNPLGTEYGLRVQLNVKQCLSLIENCHLYQTSPRRKVNVFSSLYDQNNVVLVPLDGTGVFLEQDWKLEYDRRRVIYKQKLTTLTVRDQVNDVELPMSLRIVEGTMPDILSSTDVSIVNQFEENHSPTTVLENPEVLINDIVSHWQLNDRQTQAFREVAEHALLPTKAKPLN